MTLTLVTEDTPPWRSRVLPPEAAESGASRRARARLMRSCGAAYLHLKGLGLDSSLVRGELQRILREELV